MNAKFIIEQIVMSMSFLKANMFPEHKFIKQEDEHGMYKCLKAVINHPETAYLQGSLNTVGIVFDEFKKSGKGVNYSRVLDILSEINRHEQCDEIGEVLESYLNHIITIERLPKIELFIPKVFSAAGNWNDYYNVIMGYSNSGNLDKCTFDRHIEGALWNVSRQVELISDHFLLPKNYLILGMTISDNTERRKYFIKSLRDFLFNVNHDIEEPKGDPVSDSTQAAQEILNKPIKEKDMKQEQFYTKLYFYTDAKRIIFSDGKAQDIAECFSKLSPEDQASVCHEFGILGSDSKHVPGIATVLATMLMNMEMQNLKRKLSDLVSVGFIEELHHRLADCKTWEDANKLHKYTMVTFNGMKIPDLKDIIVKYMSLDNHDQFDHDGSQLAGFFAGVIYADAMTMVKRHEEQLQCNVQGPWTGYRWTEPSLPMTSPGDFGVVSDDVSKPYVPDMYSQSFGKQMLKGKHTHCSVELSEEDVLRARAYQEELGKLFGLYNNYANKELPKAKLEDIAYTQPPRIFIVRG